MARLLAGSEVDGRGGAQTSRGATVRGLGMALPAEVVSNDPIAHRLGVDPSWIGRRTGTAQRYVASPDDRLEVLAARAADSALARAGLAADRVDAVLVGTTSAEEMSPHAAPLVAAELGARGAAALDVNAACVGFLTCLALGSALIESDRADFAVVVGADFLTRYTDFDDPRSAMLFGDGAGAVVLGPTTGLARVGPSVLHSDGSQRRLITLDRKERLIRMDGPGVYRAAVGVLSRVTLEVLQRAGLALEEVDLFVYHQANGRIIEAVTHHLGIDSARVVNVVGTYANTSAASLPIALAHADREGRLRQGDRVLLAAFGSGLVWGATLVTWGADGDPGEPGN